MFCYFCSTISYRFIFEMKVLMYRGILLLLLTGIIAIILMASVVKIYKKLGMDGM